METKNKTQKRGMKTTGSFYNWLYGNNETLPKVGEGMTELCWTDRHAYEVLWVSEDSTECDIQRYAPERVDGLGMSDCQSYKYEKLTGEKIRLVWRDVKGGGWFVKFEKVEFIPKWAKECGEYFPSNALTKEQHDLIYADPNYAYPVGVVEGITKRYTRYHKMNVAFGMKREYYDFSF